MSARESKTWIPVDVKIRWFSFLSAADLGRASRVCRSWVSLIQKTADASIVELTCATPPPLGRGAKLRFYHRLQNATDPENMGYLLAWAAGCREYTPFLHKLLLLRDVIREDFGLPGGLHEVARPDAFSQTDEDIRALFTYKGGAAGAEAVHQHPLVVAASRGNVDAVHLLLLFGEGVHANARTVQAAAGAQAAAAAAAGPKRGPYERALYVAVEQGNAAVVAALLGRVPLRPPQHPAHAAAKLGLFRPVWDVLGPGGVYSAGVTLGPRDVAGAIAGTRMRAELAAATGFTTAAGQVKASASAAMTAGGGKGGGGTAAGMGHVEAQVAQLALFEADGRYRAWCRGYRVGTYWATYDSALANWEALHGPMGAAIGADMCVPGSVLHPPPPSSAAGGSRGGGGKGSSKAGAGTPRGAGRAADLIRTTLYNLKARLDCNIAPGTSAHGSLEGCTAPFAAQALLVSRLQPTATLALLSRPATRVSTRFGGEDGRTPGVTTALPARVPAALDYGLIAAESLAVKVRLNVGPGEGRTPLWAACDLGRVEVAYLLLSHHAPALAAAALVPELPHKEEEGGGEGEAGPAWAPNPHGGAAAAGAGAAANAPPPPAAALPLGAAAALAPPVPAAAAAPPALDPAALAEARAREELSALASMTTVPALALPPDCLYCAPSSSAASAEGAGLYVPQPLLSGSGQEDRAHVLPRAQYGGLPEAGLVACPAAPQAAARREEVLSELMGERRDRVDVEACPPGQHSPLGLACERGSPLLVQLLLHWGADVNRPGRKDAPPVLTASMAHHEQVLRVLLRATCPPEPAKEVAAVVDRLRAEREGALGAHGAGVRPSTSAESEAEGEGGGAAAGRPAATGLFPLLGMPSAPAGLRALVNHGKSSALLRTVLAASGCAALRRVLTEGFRLDRDADKGTAASNAMGSTVARQRGGKKGGAGAGGGGEGSSEGRPEDPPLDLCEPSVVAALAAAAAAANNAVDEYGTPLPARPAPVDMTLFLPSDEAAAASAAGEGGGSAGPSALAYYRTGAVGTRTKLGGGAGGGRLAALLAQHRAQLSSISVLGGAFTGASGSGEGGDEAGLPPEDILTYPTSPSYLDLVAACDAFKGSVRAACLSLSSRSRACAGVGALAGRPVLDVNSGDESGYTPLFIMASAGKLETVMLLIAAGADPTLPTKRGKTAIYGAVEKRHEAVVEFLMYRYSAAQLRANTTYGTNVLHAASKAGSSKIASMLTAYCVEYDGRMQKAMRADAAARRKAQWGEGGQEGGSAADSEGELAVGGQAAEHLRKLRAAAEAAKKREAEAASSRRMGVRGASVGPRIGGAAGSGQDSDVGEEDGTGTESEVERPSASAVARAEAVYGAPSAPRGRSTSRAPPPGGPGPVAATPSKGATTGRPTLPLGQATVKLSPYSPTEKKGGGGGGLPPKAKGGQGAGPGRGRSLGPALEAAARRATISRGSSVASDDSLSLRGVSGTTPAAPRAALSSPASPAPPALPSPSRLAAGGGTGAVRRLSMASTGAPPPPAAAAAAAGAGRSPGDSTITGPRSVRSLQGGGGGSAAGSASDGGSPHSMQEVQQPGAGGSVFERLAARAKELEAKRRLQEEELGTKGRVAQGAASASASGSSTTSSPRAPHAAATEGGEAPAVKKAAAAPGPVVPKPGSKPAYLLEYERAKAAEREAAAGAGGGTGQGPGYEPGAYSGGTSKQPPGGGKAGGTAVPLSSHPRLAGASSTGGGIGAGVGRASTAASSGGSSTGSNSLDLTPLLAAAAAAAPSVVVAATAGGGKAAVVPGLPKAQGGSGGRSSAPASVPPQGGTGGVAQADNSRGSSVDSTRSGAPATAAAQDKAAAERAKRQAFLDRLTAVTVPLPGAAPAPSAAAAAPASSPAPKVNPLVAAASTSFEAAAASFAAKKAELDSMLAQLDAAETAAAASVGAGKGGAGGAGGKVLSPHKAGGANKAPAVLHDSPIAHSPIFLRPRSAAGDAGGGAADGGVGGPGRSSPTAAVQNKATLLGVGLGLPAGTPTKPSALSDGAGSSPLQGVLTRGLGLGLGQAALVAGQSKGKQASKDAPSAPSSPSKPAMDPAEVAAREERNRQREAARIARLEQARVAAEAKRREEEEMAYKGSAGAGPGAGALTSLKLAVSAYGGSLVPKKKR